MGWHDTAYGSKPGVSRRRFINIGSASLAVAALGVVRSRAAAPGCPIGLQLYTVRSELENDFEGTLARIAAIGIREVELIDFPDRKPGEVRRALDNAGLRAISIHLGGDELVGQFPKRLDLAANLGVAYLICPTPLISPAARVRPQVAAMTLDDWRWNAETFNKLGEEASKAGIQFGYHNHSAEFRRFGERVAYDELLGGTEPDLVTFEMDCGWVESSRASSVAYLRRYPGRFQLLHIKDIKRRAEPGVEQQITSTEVGRGIIDWQAIFAAAPRAGVKHCFIEQEPPFERPALESVRLSYDWLHAHR